MPLAGGLDGNAEAQIERQRACWVLRSVSTSPRVVPTASADDPVTRTRGSGSTGGGRSMACCPGTAVPVRKARSSVAMDSGGGALRAAPAGVVSTWMTSSAGVPI